MYRTKKVNGKETRVFLAGKKPGFLPDKYFKIRNQVDENSKIGPGYGFCAKLGIQLSDPSSLIHPSFFSSDEHKNACQKKMAMIRMTLS